MLTKIKLGLTIVGLLVFAAGARMDHAVLRWVGIGFVAAAFLMRFARRP